MSNVTIRSAVVEDAPALVHIYSYYVEHTAITFEYEVPSVEEFAGRIAHTLKKYPYLVAEEDGEIVGYAYAGEFKERAAYDWACELSVYVDLEKQKGGVGRALYDHLSEILKTMGIVNLYACIATSDVEDEYLNHNSEQFHAHMGFRTVGKFSNCGYKFDRWYHMIWMEKIIGAHTENQKPVVWASQL